MDEKDITKGQHHDHIDISDHHKLSDWADKLGVTNLRLKAAVKVVGSSAKKVQAYLTRGAIQSIPKNKLR